MNYQLYNQSSEDMSAVSDKSVDLIVAGPPYNIGTTYSSNPDITNADQFQTFLHNVFSECARVLKDDGTLMVECADTTYSNGLYTSLGGLIVEMVSQHGLELSERHTSFVLTENGKEIPDHGWNNSYITTNNAHSNCHQILVFTKSATFNELAGKILYYNYVSDEGHPCPFAWKLINFILDNYFSTGKVVLDPFAGTGRLGREVLRRGGSFIGFEKERAFYDTAHSFLEKI